MLRRSLIGIGALALAVPIIATPLGAAGAANRSVRLTGSMASLPAGALQRGAVPRDERVRVRVQLRLRDQAGADALAKAVSTPGSAKYRQYLTAEQFRAQFSPTDATVAKVSAWLIGQGLAVVDVPANKFSIAAEGTAAQIEAAFGTSLATVEVNGKTRRVNTSEPAIPADLVASVEGVTGLTQVLAHPTHVGAGDEIPAIVAAEAAAASSAAAGPDAPPSPGFRNAPPCSSYWNEKQATNLPTYGSGYPSPLPWAPCGWKPEQLRQAYGTSASVAKGIDGTGVTVAIVDAYASPTIYEDASTYAQRNDSNHPLKRSQFSQNIFRPQTDQALCDPQRWYTEETLDVEAVHAMAPGADILYVGAASCTDPDILDAVAWIVDHRAADIVSNSYGIAGEIIPPSELNGTLKVHTQAAIEGIGFYYSSGDAGDQSDSGYGGPVPSADWSATSPLATAVGGSSLGIDANGSVVVEQGWTTGISAFDPASGTFAPGGKGSFLYGAGGGPSRLFEQPAYQKGIVPNSIARGIGAPKRRVVPDVGMVGDVNTGFLIGQTQTFPEGVSYDEFRLGGTSLSSPLFAGVMALADQKAGYHHGFANPWLYSRAGTPAFRDIKPGPRTAVARQNFVNGVDAGDGISNPTVRTFDADLQSLRTLKGYDTLTGLGAPNGASFINAG